MNKDEIGLLLELVDKAKAEAMVAAIMRGRPSMTMIELTKLEMKLVAMKGEVT